MRERCCNTDLIVSERLVQARDPVGDKLTIRQLVYVWVTATAISSAGKFYESAMVVDIGTAMFSNNLSRFIF